uniref:Uncharacterized protein n=1 Tax=Trichuris muris TaxID=70415 RepID=A0A5S6QDL7_TRIMR
MKENAKIGDQDVDVYCDHLNILRQELRLRFEDILTVDIQKKLIELQTNEELKPKLKNGYQAFWVQPQIPNLNPRL